MTKIKLYIVTFNANEANAVSILLDDLCTSPDWSRDGSYGVKSQDIDIFHYSLLAQGNVIAAASLAELFSDAESYPDYVLFYGCAGSLDPKHVGHAFFVGKVSYASLGTVNKAKDPLSGTEQVTLKNKWLCATNPQEEVPLESIKFSEALGQGVLNLCIATSLTPAHVVATDKVIKIAPAPSPPNILQSGLPHHVYKKDEWSYAEALAFLQQHCEDLPVIVEMESYGIGKIAKANNLLDRVVIIRVITDSLSDHSVSDTNQRDYLIKGRSTIALFILTVIANLNESKT